MATVAVCNGSSGLVRKDRVGGRASLPRKIAGQARYHELSNARIVIFSYYFGRTQVSSKRWSSVVFHVSKCTDRSCSEALKNPAKAQSKVYVLKLSKNCVSNASSCGTTVESFLKIQPKSQTPTLKIKCVIRRNEIRYNTTVG